MRAGKYEVKSPLILGGEESEAEILGSAVWLWMHSPLHRDAPLHALPTLLLPIIKQRQYVLVAEAGTPVFFFSWAWLNEEAEALYLTRPAIHFPPDAWNSGTRMWCCDWIAPFGHTVAMSRLIRRDLFPHACWRALDHRGEQRGRRVFNFHGSRVTHKAAKTLRQQHPLAAALPQI
ncbi:MULTISPECIES: toxin-activating lysine-acyltransferase [Pantoea]|jgi:cytolysin-activating lysine-acyltransferase|uniref:RTX toxin-activating lysine-acyltransferase n=1 Tax=Pantoea eucrina TaxID=472693 RepID=A0ABS1Z4K5_9GAMM|nr:MULTISPECIES: toxin-activating lysine-acyltransferase [Pantoea]MBM0747061.1 toxin-activating lysine-acyltransferase [Pantoea eucrina]PPS58145.1 toxin-activating lysine-acyltransferase [Pantoea sp. BRM17]UBB14037.1 toxin-activating lysine-acyltransferase [Pantoea eucrina]